VGPAAVDNNDPRADRRARAGRADEATGFEVVEIDQLKADFAGKPDPIDDVELPDRAVHLNNIQLGKFGRSRSNVWQCPGANTFRKGRLEDLADHPTIKPVRLYAEILKDCTRPQNIALDCFGGSGTLLLASEQVGRRARVMELDPKYADVSIRRWQKYTGQDAVHIGCGITFDELREIRSRPVRIRTRSAC
jgi:DNA modification methylase